MVDPTTVQVIMSRLQSVAQEMFATLVRASYSANIKERMDCSCAVFNRRGEVIAMPGESAIPIHLSSLDGVVEATLSAFGEHDILPGDMFIANDPYGGGGSHLNDLTVVAPVFGTSGNLVSFVTNLAHHSDIGGAAVGGRAVHLATIFEEGLRIPPTRIMRGGVPQQDVIQLVALNSRLPQDRIGDLRAQLASNSVGLRGLSEIYERFGEDTVRAAMDGILDYSERRLRSALRTLPDGMYSAVDYVDDDGVGDEPMRIQVAVTKSGDSLKFDFSGTSQQANSAINSPLQATRATVLCVVKSLLDPDLPPNAGIRRPISISAPLGSLVNCTAPAAVGERMVACWIVGDVVAGALAELVPGESAAAYGGQLGYGVGCIDVRTRQYSVEYQAFAGGHGATSFADGMDSVAQWASGAPNAPIEADEIAFPIIIHRYELRDGSGGLGQYRGGLGVRRSFSVYGEATMLATVGVRMRVPPPGLFGGEKGLPACVVINPGADGEVRLTRMVTDYPLHPSDVVEVQSAGGGGWGDSRKRDPEAIRQDLHEGKILPEQAENWLRSVSVPEPAKPIVG